MQYSKTALVDAQRVAEDLQHWNPLTRLERTSGLTNIVATITGKPEDIRFTTAELAKETFIDGIASVFHKETTDEDQSKAYLEHLARKSMEAEDHVIARKQEMDIGIYAADGISRLAFVPRGTTEEQYAEYKMKLQGLAEKLTVDAVSTDLRDGGFGRHMGLGLVPPNLLNILRTADPRDALIALGRVTTSPARSDWAMALQQTLTKPELSL